MKITKMITKIGKLSIVLGLLCVALASQAKSLAISKNGKVEYILHDKELITVELIDGTKLTGLLTIVSDTSVIIDTLNLDIRDIEGVKVNSGSKSVRGVGVVGVVGGLALLGTGLSLMSSDEGLVADAINAIIGFPLVIVGGVINVISFTAILFSGGKWIGVSGIYANYELKVI